MKKFLVVSVLALLFSCTSQKKYSDFDISYVRSGGYAPIYENLVINGKSAHYSFEGQGKKSKINFSLTEADLENIDRVLAENNFRQIEEGHQKIYDNIGTTIIVKKGPNAGSKTDASSIMQRDQNRWDNITNAFRKIIESKTTSKQQL